MKKSSGISREPLWKIVAGAIRQDIENSQWTDTLPGEHKLTIHYEVGRRTIRDALVELEDEGLIGKSPGKPRQILNPGATSSGKRLPDHVILLSPYAVDKGISKSRIVFNQMVQELSKRDVHLITRRIDTGSEKALNRSLGQLKKQFPRSVWLLHDCSESVQRWCEKQGEQALILGVKTPGSIYTSVEMDAEVVISRAVNYFGTMGHHPSNILFLMRRDPGEINTRARELFCGNIKARAPNSQIRLLEHDDTNLIDLLGQRLSGSHPPSGLLCWRTHDAIRAVTFLTHLGVQIPNRLSIISCGSTPTMEFIHPEITRFLSPSAEYERCFIRLLIKLIKGEARNGAVLRFVPEFLEGKTVSTPGGK
ncbi:MAG: substrate-binding domain-containing protein [Verrucomicrobiales bacterium]|nr:substrate-binding domain-containing protein [Verrucomicrobiales bacterium]